MSDTSGNYRLHPTPKQTLVRTLGLAGLVLLVGGTGIVLKTVTSTPSGLGDGPRPAHAISLYVSELETSKSPASGAKTETVVLNLEAAYSTNYPRMDASEIDAKYAIFAKPGKGDCCWQPRRISWHDDAMHGELALPMTYVPTLKTNVPNVQFGTIEKLELPIDDADGLRPILLSHVPVVATIDIGSPDNPRVYDLRPATDAEISTHARARSLASRT